MCAPLNTCAGNRSTSTYSYLYNPSIDVLITGIPRLVAIFITPVYIYWNRLPRLVAIFITLEYMY